ncbi:MAG: aminoacyl-tRNA hydrolase [Campylobacteraceae bacterium]|jgi:PTH1 family peptidyl-tRNA hydrolase|nr:aminoacyl-tRNA hydrolase [Campylobacteraceae bacterium]MBT3882826.1 aminoacyl-tRNA hydrolase [Campylobacteraceae bacterium]MBT4030144.1 aminoacyl-tRNA hydrolase [Campylobacteraceae bacterium]MBT4179764.1 aminoacyl-tRNA hydrolase [Campylobacteraceae bacterium]MBT4573198.1 aminoacyl-tRNA hydrolase [Campylobacteraceae bacterium]
MFLIAGLGNPGEKYSHNRHNIGFLIIDKIIKNLTTNNINNPNFKSICYKAPNTIYAKPQTFMNLSGESIIAIADYYDISNDNIIIIHDDIDLEFGSLKFKIGGGHGGHNGLRSIDSHCGKDYIRVRVGVGKPSSKSDVANFVLSDFSKEEFKELNDTIINHTIKAIEDIKKTNDLTQIKSTYTLSVKKKDK